MPGVLPSANCQSSGHNLHRLTDSPPLRNLCRPLTSSCLGGEIGRRARLKLWCPQGRAGSTPAPGTMYSGTELGESLYHLISTTTMNGPLSLLYPMKNVSPTDIDSASTNPVSVSW